jgi:transcriptional regulator with GAF, ATPase, and Fis domain
MQSPSTIRFQQSLVPVSAALAVVYALVVLWYVATYPELGIRCLLPKERGASTYHEGVEVVRFSGEGIPYQLQPGDRLTAIHDRPVHTFLDFLGTTRDLSTMALQPGAKLHPGADPADGTRDDVPPLVSIPDPDTGGTVVRYVRVDFKQKNAAPEVGSLYTYIAVNPPAAYDVLLTVLWFLCQSAILLIALTGYWQRPSDVVTQTFCLMSSATMVAFVGGFHWWIIAGNPVLNLPFALCIMVVPAVTLHFFLQFPRENRLLAEYRRLTLSSVYAPLGALSVVVVFTYWSAFCLNGTPVLGRLSAMQQVVAVTRELLMGDTSVFPAATLSWELLYWLRRLIYLSIFVSGAYFALTICSIVLSLFRTQTVIERQQASTILWATLSATIPVSWTLYLAFYSKDVFVLGGAQLPMFAASGMFMAAYAHGMLKRRLILSDEKLHRGRLYRTTSLFLTIGFAALLAAGVVSARQYSMPASSSLALRMSLYVILIVAVGFALWIRDRIQAAIDLRFFSEKYQLDRALEQLNQAAGHLTDPTAMANMTLRTCREVVDASSAMMYVREGSGTLRLIGAHESPSALPSMSGKQIKLLAASEPVVLRVPAQNRESMEGIQILLDELGIELILTLRDDREVAGAICLGRRQSNTPYSAEDIAFLQAIGQMTLLALHSSRANQTLARLTSELQVKVDHISEQQRQLSVLRAELMAIEQHTTSASDPEETTGFNRSGLRGTSQVIEQVLETARKASNSSSTVLIRGESGTGKELMARIIQQNSPREAAPFVTVNCAALAPSLLESELFGHVRGAFTGAESDKAGRFQAADGGTLFLDEIGDISPETQVKLLRVLQERCFEPVGSDRSVAVDVRVITATHRNLEEMISAGTFREDLYYRLNVVSITLPPLRDRREDLLDLIFSFLKNSVNKTGKKVRQIDPIALVALENHSWPGNIRELENAIERAVVLADGDIVQLSDLPDDIASHTPIVADRSSRDGELRTSLSIHEDTTVPVTQTTLEFSGNVPEERMQLLDALRTANGNKAQAARLLNMPRSTFYSKLKKFRIDA